MACGPFFLKPPCHPDELLRWCLSRDTASILIRMIYTRCNCSNNRSKRGSRQLGIGWFVQDKRKPGHNLSASQKKRNRKHSSIRARVEHVFRVIKRQFGFTKTRYRGLMKNTVQVNMLVGLANLYLLRRRLMAA